MKHHTGLLVAALVAAAPPLSAQTSSRGDHRPEAASFYGSAVAVGDREVLIAEPVSSRSPGVVYVYRRDRAGRWAETQRLTASDATIMDRFGRAIAVDGGILLAGATSRDSARGGAYIFTRDAAGRWSEAQRLVASDAVAGDALGRAVALRGDLALVASWGNNKSAGAVYVFRRDGGGRWVQEAKLTAADAAEDDFFGTGLAIEGDRVLIGASERQERAGAAYVFRYDRAARAWQPEGRLAPSGLEANAGFGAAAALRQGTAYV
ncbi:MAG: FG-GAP repeat protein, partial [Gemmatimonadales bacterium]